MDNGFDAKAVETNGLIFGVTLGPRRVTGVGADASSVFIDTSIVVSVGVMAIIPKTKIACNE